jgi:sugar phosphate isomerase/epimerase
LRLGLVTEGMIHRSLDELMDWLDEDAPDVRLLEVGTGGYSPLGHSPLSLSAVERRGWYEHIRARDFEISAFNVSGNPLHPSPLVANRHDGDLRATIELATELGVERIVAMSGCPGSDSGESQAPHFAANAWLPDYVGVATWQWENVVRPYWEEINELVERSSADLMICLELHPGAHVFNVDTFERLNTAAPRIGANLDPSHLFWQGMDPLKVVERLGLHIGHSHAKDVRYHGDGLALNGLLDNRWPGEPEAIGWDFAAVGLGEHGADWWQTFARALESATQARVISIEHEDRLHSPEVGVTASAQLFERQTVGPLA